MEPTSRNGNPSILSEKSILTRVIRCVDPLLEGYGHRVDLALKKLDPRWQYLGEILLRVPMLLLMHQWCLLSPTSSYWFIEIFLFILKYLGNITSHGEMKNK